MTARKQQPHTAAATGHGPAAAAVSLSQDFITYLCTARNYSVHTLRAYENDLRAFLSWAGEEGLDVCSLGHRQLRGYLARLEARGYARSTVNRHLSAIRAFYAWMQKEGHIASDPCSVLEGPKQPHTLPKVLGPHDVQTLLDGHTVKLPSKDMAPAQRLQAACELRDQALLELLFASGARIAVLRGHGPFAAAPTLREALRLISCLEYSAHLITLSKR
jgi:integrase/recombinase XerD